MVNSKPKAWSHFWGCDQFIQFASSLLKEMAKSKNQVLLRINTTEWLKYELDVNCWLYMNMTDNKHTIGACSCNGWHQAYAVNNDISISYQLKYHNFIIKSFQIAQCYCATVLKNMKIFLRFSCYSSQTPSLAEKRK